MMHGATYGKQSQSAGRKTYTPLEYDIVRLSGCVAPWCISSDSRNVHSIDMFVRYFSFLIHITLGGIGVVELKNVKKGSTLF